MQVSNSSIPGYRYYVMSMSKQMIPEKQLVCFMEEKSDKWKHKGKQAGLLGQAA